MTPTSSPTPGKLGIVAGGGELPLAVLKRCEAAGRPYFVLRLRGFADPLLGGAAGADVGLAELGKAITLLRAAGCGSVCLAGLVNRPDFSALKPDLRGLKALPAAILAAGQGDDALLRFVLGEFEKEGFRIEGAEGVGVATLAAGPLGARRPSEGALSDIRLGIRAAKALGELDIGQAVVVCRGVVLALEAQEGTDALLRRTQELPATLRGSAASPSGVLVKWPKPRQDRRVDLPTLGVRTLEGVAAADLEGVAVEAGAALILDLDAVKATADRLGLFVLGVEPKG